MDKATHVKILRRDLTHHKFKYVLGLNIDILEFDPSGTCRPGGLYFTTERHLHKFLDYGEFIAYLYVPDGVSIYAEGDKWKAPAIYITKIINILDYEGDNMHINKQIFIRHCIFGNLEKVKYLLDKGVVVTNMALRCTNRHNYVSVMKELLSRNIAIDLINTAFLSACLHKHFEIMELLLDKGADVHAENDWALHNAQCVGDTDVIEWLQRHQN